MGFLVVWVMLLKIEFNDLQVGWGSRNVSGVLEGIRMVFIQTGFIRISQSHWSPARRLQNTEGLGALLGYKLRPPKDMEIWYKEQLE